MSTFKYPFTFSEEDLSQIQGTLELDKPLPFHYNSWGSGFYRPARINIDGYPNLEIVLYHTEATSAFMYLRSSEVDPNQLDIIGIPSEEIADHPTILLPGQLCLGSERSRLIAKAIKDIFGAPTIKQTVNPITQQNIAIFPIAREGLKYHVSEAIFENYGYYCDEVILDAHHVFDSSVPVYNRKVEMTIFKDKDLDKSQRDIVTVAFLADSIASGLVMKEVIARVKERFEKLERIEVISPLATIRGLCRVARSEVNHNTKVRVHVFETLLNALPPDYYYSAHFGIPEFHIRPELEQEYREWWGMDQSGAAIADTACAGYGWSEVFYSPRKQLQMINNQLLTRHQLTIRDIIRRNLPDLPG
jgi:hypothetical protein